MTRICNDFVYGDGPIKDSFWAETVSVPTRSALEKDIKTDVAIIGAGFTGLNAALSLAQAGTGVAVLDAKQVGWGASGRNGGFCCLGGSGASYPSLQKRFGLPALSDYVQAERSAVDYVDRLIDDGNWQVDRHSNGETLLAHTPKIAEKFAPAARDLSATYGVPIEVLRKEELSEHGFGGAFHGALTKPIGFALNPAKYVSNLAQYCETAGAVIYGDTPVTQTEHIDGHWHVHTPKGRIIAKTLIVATNGYSSEHIPAWMAGRYLPAQSSIMVTRPITQAEQADQGWTSAQMAYDSRNLLHYFRLMPDGRFLFGMRGGLATHKRADDHIRRQIRREFAKMFPAWANVEATHHWSGFVCYNRKMSPFAGAVPGAENLYAGFAYHGNGVAMGSYAGALIAQDILGASDLLHPDILRATTGRFPLGRYRRLLMYPAYLLYGLKDL
ncbi:NAD(P)/FAD-dependent oxidoreductase [Shimia sp.]|uniref:NAD(P)/FAD-dependent oxidoreductase n=1 Tax=Shimia sp. TaxID=1954381 RepID=UPI003B8B3895